MSSLSFPMRLQENGLLRRSERSAALISLLQMMARTPQGSWKACPNFGLRDLFEDARLRADAAQLAMERINQSLTELQITGYAVTEVVRELSAGRDVDTYAITLEDISSQERITTSVAPER